MILLQLQVGGHEHHGTDAGPRGRGGHGVGQVAGGRAGEHLEAHLGGGGQGHRHHPVLERVRRVAPVVLDPEPAHAQRVSEVVGADQPGVAGLGRGPLGDVGRDREQRRVAPHVRRAGLDVGPGQPRVVVADFQRPETVVAGVVRAELVDLAALAAGQPGGVAEPGSCIGRACRCCGHRRGLPSPSFPAVTLTAGRSWHHVTRLAVRRRACIRDRLPGLRRADPSTPLDERYSVVSQTGLRVPVSQGRPLPDPDRRGHGPRACTSLPDYEAAGPRGV